MSRILIQCLAALCFIQSSVVIAPQGKYKPSYELIEDFVSSDWGNVAAAKEALESRQADAIPLLLQVLERDQRVELDNTLDLIYPGAKRFYGHGWMLDYDVDWLSVRAGWALEEITFQNFGFREGAIKEADLMTAVLNRQSEVRLSDPSKTAETRKRIRAEAVARAKAWWETAKVSWNRFDAVLEALRSDDPVRQLWTLNWIRHGKTKCDGLTVENFDKQIVPEAMRLSKSKDKNVSDQAQLLLDDKNRWWLKYKNGER